MRTIIATCAGLVALSAISVQATPLPPFKAVPTELTISPPIELAAEGCGYGQRPLLTPGPARERLGRKRT
jgi:hypothetical protein